MDAETLVDLTSPERAGQVSSEIAVGSSLFGGLRSTRPE
jgi:hypothetical protein